MAKIVVVSSRGREVEFESKGAFYKKALGYWPSGTVIKAFNNGGQIRGYRLKVETKPVLEEKIELIEEEKAEVVEVKEEIVDVIEEVATNKEITEITSKEMYMDLALGCEGFCEKYEITEANFYKLHFEATRSLTEMTGFYKVMCGYPVNLSDTSKQDKELSTAYHAMEFYRTENESVMIERYKKMLGVLDERRDMKNGRNFQKFIKEHSMLRFTPKNGNNENN